MPDTDVGQLLGTGGLKHLDPTHISNGARKEGLSKDWLGPWTPNRSNRDSPGYGKSTGRAGEGVASLRKSLLYNRWGRIGPGGSTGLQIRPHTTTHIQRRLPMRYFGCPPAA